MESPPISGATRRHRMLLLAADVTEQYHLVELLRILLFLLVIWTSGAIWMWVFERDNPSFATLGQSAWALVVYLLSGFEEFLPSTTAGRIGGSVTILVGIAMIGVFTANVAAILVERKRWAGHLKIKPPFVRFEDHVLICGWNDMAHRIIGQLHHPVIRRRRPIVVVAPRAREIRIEDRRAYRDVWAVEGDPSSDETLLSADVRTAESAILLDGIAAGAEDPRARDAFVILTALAVRSVARGVHTAIELHLPESRQRLGPTQVDECVCGDEYAARLLAQTAVQPGLGEFYRRVLSVEASSDEVYFVPLGRALAGRTYRAIRLALLDAEDVDLTAVGYRAADGRLVVNPPPSSAALPLAAGDELIVLARRPPDTDHLARLVEGA